MAILRAWRQLSPWGAKEMPEQLYKSFLGAVSIGRLEKDFEQEEGDEEDEEDLERIGRTPASVGGQVEVRRNFGLQVVVQQNSGPQVVVRCNSGHQLVVRRHSGSQVVVRRNFGIRRWSGGTPASGGGPAELRASSGGPAELRRQAVVQRNSGQWSRRSKEARTISDLSLVSLGLRVPFQEKERLYL
ncbi:hypothetical protein M5K25_011868 [Dendrobium thyrsiflorum]|uniref:Uncharacterized protein n=1 Tax=Dendrobium thyrsiflorum TaxID=117978 RepID=A0ABD0V3V0_DENTH